MCVGVVSEEQPSARLVVGKSSRGTRGRIGATCSAYRHGQGEGGARRVDCRWRRWWRWWRRWRRRLRGLSSGGCRARPRDCRVRDGLLDLGDDLRDMLVVEAAPQMIGKEGPRDPLRLVGGFECDSTRPSVDGHGKLQTLRRPRTKHGRAGDGREPHPHWSGPGGKAVDPRSGAAWSVEVRLK